MIKIEFTPAAERPRERCLETGPDCLSLRECIALILGSGPPKVGCLGLAAQILERPGKGLGTSDEERSFFTAMEVSGISYLKEHPGLGPAGQAKILAAFELGRRYTIFRQESQRKSSKETSLPEIALRALGKISNKHRNSSQEWLGFVPVHRSGELGELCLVERGVRTHVNIEPGELFARILALRPQAIFLFHNHPSGNVTPSLQDFDLTEKVREISEEFGIQLLGHWIVAAQDERWVESR